ncbi:tetratricopeptide repeat protein [Winogradskyella bathintestinalis]|uniref:Tetratricopeptide repeat protein n=1 Tax=Winogradskyella bathintestinalis TaxID=3035208 RepID=A0ABT7ZYH8_9FLAO|nr:tetratricopeptide repeat protein [Winogradskyella bathintestinalis]MDN3494058.1 tetratricopeptide repeat protein [Winogradskyella bathintestinalis]
MNLPHLSQNEFEQIEKYLNGWLDDSDLHDFDQRLNNDSDFKTKVEELKITIMGIEAQTLKEQLNKFHNDIESHNIKHNVNDSKIYNFNWKRLVIAATLVIAAGSFWIISGNLNNQLYSKYFTPDPGLPTTMSSSDNYKFYEAMVDYKQGNYNTAISKWERLQNIKINNDTLNYFIGVAHLANQKEHNAISFLEKVTKNSEFALVNDAYYYLGLAYLKSNDLDKAKSNLQHSTIDNSKALLSELND